ncbi:hypothetical protein FBY12_0728 [Pseudomonas sp. SJZ131]|nr:hypothetical protein FBY12_0728 [Pseudomonas sp. SJZ131]
MHRSHLFRDQHNPCGERACSRWAAQRSQNLVSAAHSNASKLARHGFRVRLTGVSAGASEKNALRPLIRDQHPPVASELARAGLRSGPQNLVSAAHSNASKLARHGFRVRLTGVLAGASEKNALRPPISRPTQPLWRASLLALGCAAAPKSRERCALKREQARSPRVWCVAGGCFHRNIGKDASVPPISRPTQPLWRASELARAGLRSGPKTL